MSEERRYFDERMREAVGRAGPRLAIALTDVPPYWKDLSAWGRMAASRVSANLQRLTFTRERTDAG
jgi:hypothetical protein